MPEQLTAAMITAEGRLISALLMDVDPFLHQA